MKLALGVGPQPLNQFPLSVTPEIVEKFVGNLMATPDVAPGAFQLLSAMIQSAMTKLAPSVPEDTMSTPTKLSSVTAPKMVLSANCQSEPPLDTPGNSSTRMKGVGVRTEQVFAPVPAQSR